jgi:hypothetical protein
MWTRIKDKLPTQDNYFLVFDGQDVIIAWFQHREVSNIKPLLFYNEYNHPLDVTHWMPIPKPPEIIHIPEKVQHERHV